MTGTLPPPPPPPPPPRKPLSDAEILELLQKAGDTSTALNETRGRAARATLLSISSIALTFLGLRLLFPGWEYRVESVDESRFEQDLNRLGQGGWELVTPRRAQPSADGRTEMVFKRRRLF